MTFAKEYKKLIKEYRFGIDYVDFHYNGYLLFGPLCREVLRVFTKVTTKSFTEHIAQHNCIISQSTKTMPSPFQFELHYMDYVVKPYKTEEKFYKFFLIDMRRINYESKVGISFVSFNYSDKIHDFNGTLFDGTGHYFNLNKIHKNKYFKGSTILQNNKKFYQKQLPGILQRTMDAFTEQNEGIFDKVKITWYPGQV